MIIHLCKKCLIASFNVRIVVSTYWTDDSARIIYSKHSNGESSLQSSLASQLAKLATDVQSLQGVFSGMVSLFLQCGALLFFWQPILFVHSVNLPIRMACRLYLSNNVSRTISTNATIYMTMRMSCFTIDLLMKRKITKVSRRSLANFRLREGKLWRTGSRKRLKGTINDCI